MWGEIEKAAGAECRSGGRRGRCRWEGYGQWVRRSEEGDAPHPALWNSQDTLKGGRKRLKLAIRKLRRTEREGERKEEGC